MQLKKRKKVKNKGHADFMIYAIQHQHQELDFLFLHYMTTFDIFLPALHFELALPALHLQNIAGPRLHTPFLHIRYNSTHSLDPWTLDTGLAVTGIPWPC